ncbi:30S ribosomal protein S3Ae [Candidatus Mancarchaeum acidiphilum]|uniref:30S ribosomal protein S3Ae n=1 Tax=Candidatus Mancarchaeum acidiphilum TaxID=1920749 RepID=A0A218NLZ6_9ARCH|nr:hypothetical protein [Candidatus Mancarchaeum acidiphilum]ASI13497.1 30S ribosomal protein S3Ae [Candidatus Mancarchaeum acidiphilum]
MALQKKDNWKFKKWFTVYAPAVFGGNIVVGEMPANSDKNILNRNIRISLNSLTNNPSHMYTTAVLKVNEVNGDNLNTKLSELRLPYSYLRSLVRRYRSISNSRVEGVTKDGIKTVIKSLVVTRERSPHTKIVGIRKEMTDYINKTLPNLTYDEVVKSIMEGRLQSDIKSSVEHIAKVNRVEVVALEFK